LYGSVAELARAAASVHGSGGVSIRPALNGLGAPHHDSSRRAAIVGLSGATTRAHVARAAFESIAFRVREIAEAAGDIAGIEVAEALPVDGGVAASDLFLQIQADLLARPVDRHHQIEATALGACIAAAIGAGLATHGELAHLARKAKHFAPSIGADEAEARCSEWQAALGLSAAAADDD
jgi:glycerol kinase